MRERGPDVVVAALMLPGSPGSALFGVGAVALLLLFLGIHKEWDAVTYLALLRLQPPEQTNERRPARVRPAAPFRRRSDEEV